MMKNMRNLGVVAGTAIVVSLTLAACSGGGSILGGGTDPMANSRQVALVLPPDFAATPPPAGTTGNAAVGNEAEVLEAMFGGPATRSPAETAALRAAGRDNAQPGIRSSVGEE